ncbi:NADP-dependent oxidoreductase [Actinomadura fulvescens]|uniref:NADP-dependent oxidoreductase n=1 Tax=Actinomadura fulvescens TaxID=46160 RepID=A0ABP6CAY5_9ACTN
MRAASFVPDELEWPGTWADRTGRERTPSIPAHEVAGVVSEVRYGTSGLAVGDRVFGLTDWHRDGAAAEYVAVEARNLAPIPEELGFVQAAALPLAGLTAWQGLFVHGELRPGQRVLIHGAGGGTGTLAVQLAREAGAHVIATGRGRAAEVAAEMGAKTFVDLERERFEDVEPVDLVFDTIGGELLERSAGNVKPGGTLVSITAPPPVRPEGGRAVFFIVEPNRDQLTELARRAAAGLLRPHVGAVHPLAEAREAFQGKRGVPGKVVLEI